MKLIKLKEKIAPLVIFSKNILRTLEPKTDILDANIKYWLKKGELLQLKRGLYIFKEIFDKELQKDLLLEYIACQLIKPSYLSLEYILSKYQLLTEISSTFTLVTTKTTRQISNKLGTFRYYSVSPSLFLGFKLKNSEDYPIYEAYKEKALFDYLYLRFIKNTPINWKAIDNLRINWDNINKSEFKKMKKYLKFTKSKRLKEVFKIIGDKILRNAC